MKQISGSIVALVTPFNEDGSVDHGRLRALVDWHIANGTDAIPPRHDRRDRLDHAGRGHRDPCAPCSIRHTAAFP